MDDRIEAWVQRGKELAEECFTGGAVAEGCCRVGEDDELREEVVSALVAHLRTTPEGFVLVPVEPTPKMSAAGFCVSEADHDPAGVYRAMLAASQESGT